MPIDERVELPVHPLRDALTVELWQMATDLLGERDGCLPVRRLGGATLPVSHAHGENSLRDLPPNVALLGSSGELVAYAHLWLRYRTCSQV